MREKEGECLGRSSCIAAELASPKTAFVVQNGEPRLPLSSLPFQEPLRPSAAEKYQRRRAAARASREMADFLASAMWDTSSASRAAASRFTA